LKRQLGSTVLIERPTWLGAAFAEPEANQFWLQLPPSLKQIAMDEFHAGNRATQILRNDARSIVLLAFERGPVANSSVGDGIKVHRQHAYGNYCYDGTVATYEDIQSGCFLAFDDPSYDHETF
jgi:hypothetical protein